jgi:hypothetical protein
VRLVNRKRVGLEPRMLGLPRGWLINLLNIMYANECIIVNDLILIDRFFMIFSFDDIFLDRVGGVSRDKIVNYRITHDEISLYFLKDSNLSDS